MASISHELKGPSLDGASHVRQGTQNNTAASVVKLVGEGVQFGAKTMAGSELSEAEQLAQQEIGAALQEDYGPIEGDANARALQEFQQNLRRVNAVGVAKEQADIRTKSILKKWTNRMPGLAREFGSIAAGVSGTGSDARTIQSSAEQQQKILNAQVESLKAAAGKHGLIFSTDPVFLQELYERMSADDVRERIKREAEVRKLSGENNKEFQTLAMPKDAYAVSSSLPGFFQGRTGLNLTDPNVLSRINSDNNLKTQVLGNMKLGLSDLRSQMRIDYPNLPVETFNANFKAIEDNYNVLFGMVDGTLSTDAFATSNNLADAKTMSKIYNNPQAAALHTAAKAVPGLINNLAFAAEYQRVVVPVLFNEAPIFPPVPVAGTEDKEKDVREGRTLMVTKIAEQLGKMEPAELDTESGKAFTFFFARALDELGKGGDIPAKAYQGVFEAAIRDPEGWIKITKGANVQNLPNFNAAMDNFFKGKILPSVNKAVAALKSRPWWGEADAEVLDYKLEDNRLTFTPLNPKDPNHVRTANEFNTKYGKPLNVALAAADKISSPEKTKEYVELAKLSLNFGSAYKEGKKSGLIAGSMQSRVEGQQARAIVDRYTDRPATLEILRKVEERNPSLADNEDWSNLKNEAIEAGRIGDVPDFKIIKDAVEEGKAKAAEPKDELSSMTQEFQEIKKLDPTATFEMYLAYKREQVA